MCNIYEMKHVRHQQQSDSFLIKHHRNQCYLCLWLLYQGSCSEEQVPSWDSMCRLPGRGACGETAGDGKDGEHHAGLTSEGKEGPGERWRCEEYMALVVLTRPRVCRCKDCTVDGWNTFCTCQLSLVGSSWGSECSTDLSAAVRGCQPVPSVAGSFLQGEPSSSPS